jgi:hypothetical protein
MEEESYKIFRTMPRSSTGKNISEVICFWPSRYIWWGHSNYASGKWRFGCIGRMLNRLIQIVNVRDSQGDKVKGHGEKMTVIVRKANNVSEQCIHRPLGYALQWYSYGFELLLFFISVLSCTAEFSSTRRFEWYKLRLHSSNIDRDIDQHYLDLLDPLDYRNLSVI